MLLSLLTKEEKFYFIDLLRQLILVDGEENQIEKQIVSKFKYEMGADVYRYKKSSDTLEELLKYFETKQKTTQNIVFMNLYSASLEDEWYNVEQHFLLENIQEHFTISNKKKNELLKIVYSERDLKEKAKRAICD
ncbi:MAG: hypothetical protein WCS56_01515 [Bacilli bacterium]